jgi:hypothetical protein
MACIRLHHRYADGPAATRIPSIAPTLSAICLITSAAEGLISSNPFVSACGLAVRYGIPVPSPEHTGRGRLGLPEQDRGKEALRTVADGMTEPVVVEASTAPWPGFCIPVG